MSIDPKKRTYLAVAAVGNVGKTTIAKHVLVPEARADVFTLETQSGDGEGNAVSGTELAAHLFSPPATGLVLDIGVGDTVPAIKALQLVARQDLNLPARLRIVVPLLPDAKSIAGLRWLLAEIPECLRGSVRTLWNRVRSQEPIREDLARAARVVIKQGGGAPLCRPVLHESALFDPIHPLMRRYASIAALASIPDTEIRAAALSEMPALLAGRDKAQRAVANCHEVFAAIAY